MAGEGHHCYHIFYYNTNDQLLIFFSLCMTSYDLGEVGQGQADVPPWVDMMLHFRAAANRTYGTQSSPF